jgi:biotin carboxyl carrier protein
MIDYVVISENTSKEVKVLDEEYVLFDGKKKKYLLTEINSHKYLLNIDNTIFEATLLANSNGMLEVFLNQKAYKVKVLTTLQDKALKLLQKSEINQSTDTKIKSPMPGLVLKINKKIGDRVTRGETVLVLEAMKMENEIKSPVDGQIMELFVEPGNPVEKNIILFSVK